MFGQMLNGRHFALDVIVEIYLVDIKKLNPHFDLTGACGVL